MEEVGYTLVALKFKVQDVSNPVAGIWLAPVKKARQSPGPSNASAPTCRSWDNVITVYSITLNKKCLDIGLTNNCCCLDGLAACGTHLNSVINCFCV